MKTFFITVLAAAAFILTAVEIPFTVENRSGLKGSHTIRVSLPFPKGKFKNADDFGVFDGKKQFAADITILNRWPQDRSLRWASVVFKGELTGARNQKFIVKTGVRPLKAARKEAFASFKFTPYFITASGDRYTAKNPEYTQIVEENALRKMIKSEGFFRNGKNEPFCRYIIRQEFRAGSSESKLYFTFVITGDEKQAKFKDIGIEFPGQFKKGVFGGVKGNAMNRYLLQYAYDKFLTAPVASPASWRPKGDGKQAPGWAAADRFRVAVEEFAENFPNELEIKPTALIYHFWPAHGVKDPTYKVTDANRQYLHYCHEGKILDFTAPSAYWDVGNDYIKRYFNEGKIESPMGVAKTAVLRIDPRAGAQAPCAEVTALPDPVWLCNSGVMRNIHPYDPKNFPAEEKMLYSWFALERQLALTAPGDFGKWNYGDTHSVWRPDLKRWDDFYRTWKGYHHSSGNLPWLLALRKGDFDICRRAIAVSRHLMDIDICNWSTKASEAPVKNKKLEWRRKIKGALNDYKGLSHWHAGSRNPDYNSQTEFALLYYYITGDIRGLDVAKMWGEASLKLYRKPLQGRPATGMISALTDLWLATSDERYKALIEKHLAKLAATQLKGRYPLSSQLQQGAMLGWANYQPGIQKYYDATGSETAKKILKAWAECTVKGYSERTNPQALDLPVYGWLLTGKTDYLRYAAWLAECGMYNYAIPAGEIRHMFNSVQAFFLERLPFWMWAVNKYGKKVSPLAVSSGSSQFPYEQAGTYPKEGSFSIYLKSDGKPFDLACGFATGKSKKAQITLSTQSGKTLFSKELTPGAGKNADFSLKNVKAPAGVLTLKIGPKIRRVAMECRLPRVSVPGTHYNNNKSGGLWAFRIPEAGTLTVEAVKTMDYPVNLQLESPDGAYAGSILFRVPYDGAKKSYSFKVTPGIWQLKGHFGTSKFTLKINGKKIPYVSPGKNFWFDKE